MRNFAFVRIECGMKASDKLKSQGSNKCMVNGNGSEWIGKTTNESKS